MVLGRADDGHESLEELRAKEGAKAHQSGASGGRFRTLTERFCFAR